AADHLTSEVKAQKADQAITITQHAPATAVFGTSFNVAANGGGSNNPVTFTSGGVCSNSGAIFTMTSGTGICALKYDQAGNDNYDPALQVTEYVTAQKADQSITLSNTPNSAVYHTTFTPTATSTSGLAVAITVTGVCSRGS